MDTSNTTTGMSTNSIELVEAGTDKTDKGSPVSEDEIVTEYKVQCYKEKPTSHRDRSSAIKDKDSISKTELSPITWRMNSDTRDRIIAREQITSSKRSVYSSTPRRASTL